MKERDRKRVSEEKRKKKELGGWDNKRDQYILKNSKF